MSTLANLSNLYTIGNTIKELLTYNKGFRDNLSNVKSCVNSIDEGNLIGPLENLPSNLRRLEGFQRIFHQASQRIKAAANSLQSTSLYKTDINNRVKQINGLEGQVKKAMSAQILNTANLFCRDLPILLEKAEVLDTPLERQSCRQALFVSLQKLSKFLEDYQNHLEKSLKEVPSYSSKMKGKKDLLSVTSEGIAFQKARIPKILDLVNWHLQEMNNVSEGDN